MASRPPALTLVQFGSVKAEANGDGLAARRPAAKWQKMKVATAVAAAAAAAVLSEPFCVFPVVLLAKGDWQPVLSAPCKPLLRRGTAWMGFIDGGCETRLRLFD